jgi:hypothetical protein
MLWHVCRTTSTMFQSLYAFKCSSHRLHLPEQRSSHSCTLEHLSNHLRGDVMWELPTISSIIQIFTVHSICEFIQFDILIYLDCRKYGVMKRTGLKWPRVLWFTFVNMVKNFQVPSSEYRISQTAGWYLLLFIVGLCILLRVLSKLSENRHSQQLYEMFLFVVLTTCFGLYNGHPQAILIIFKYLKKFTIPTTDPLCLV